MKAECEHGLDTRLPCGDCQKAYEEENAPSSVQSTSLLACCDCEFWSESGEEWASCVANPIPFSTGIPGHFVQTRRDYLCAYGKRKANDKDEARL